MHVLRFGTHSKQSSYQCSKCSRVKQWIFLGTTIYYTGETAYITSFTFKLFFSITLATMQLRFFQSYYVFRSIGPKVIMIKEMVNLNNLSIKHFHE